MTYKKKSWREKLADDKNFPKIVKIQPRQEKIWGKGTIVIPKPREVEEIMKKVPRGELTTINQIREKLALTHHATIGCPICTGIFARIAAEVGQEDIAEGKPNPTPYWRTLKEGGVINEKYPGGCESQKTQLEAEGHKVIKKGKKYTVKNYQKYLLGERCRKA